MVDIEYIRNLTLFVLCFVIPLIIFLMIVIWFGGDILDKIKKIIKPCRREWRKMRLIKAIMYKPFRGLNWWQKIIGIFIFVPFVIPMVFYKMYISKEWKPCKKEWIRNMILALILVIGIILLPVFLWFMFHPDYGWYWYKKTCQKEWKKDDWNERRWNICVSYKGWFNTTISYDKIYWWCWRT